MPGLVKWSLVGVAAIALLFAAFLLHTRLVQNPRVVRELRADPHGERAGIVMLLTFPDGREIPVNYLREGDTVFAASDGLWWRALRDGAPVSLEIRGETLTGHAEVVLDDSAYRREVFRRLRPAAPSWLPDWLDAKLVVVTLDAD